MKLIFKLYKNTRWLPAGLFTFLIISAGSCKKVDDMELNKGDNLLALSVDKSSFVLMQKNDAADALVFTWTSGTNKGTNAAISYNLMIDKKGAGFSDPMQIVLGNGVTSKKFTVKAFNDSLTARWNLDPEIESVVEAKVVSFVADNLAPSETSNIIELRLTPYKPVTTTLYLIGDATHIGWDADNAIPLTASATQAGKFTWQGNLSAGELKFITTTGHSLPSYNKGATETSLFYRTDDDQPDDRFSIPGSGSYQIEVDLLNLKVSIAESSDPPYSELWIVGDATPNGWNINDPNKMRVDSSDLWAFHFNEILNAGEFKIPVSTGNWGTDFYMPLTNHPPISTTTAQLVPGGNPDNKWQITAPGPYKIKLNTKDNTINIAPFTPYTDIWMVGDATPVGWNIDNPQPMTPVAGDPYKFVYEGPMNAGEFKLPLATGNWGADYFMPVIDQSGMGSTQMKFVAAGNPDHKWRLAEAGTYRITIDQLRETISIIKVF